MLQAILLGLFISLIISSTILGHTGTILFKIKKYWAGVKTKIFIGKLENLNYFQYHNLKEKKELKKIIIKCGSRLKIIDALWNQFTFSLDKRSFIIDEDAESGRPLIDSKGIIDSQSGYNANKQTDNTEFYNFAKQLGLNIKIENLVYSDKEQTNAQQEIKINKSEYSLHINYEDENYGDQFIFEFAEIINQELLKISSVERIFLMDNYPAFLIFLPDKIYKYLLSLSPEKRQTPFKPIDWLRNRE
ncbi:hypothetical protein [Ferruginibacter sp.]|nr:hypothetical protein [Ferruginibacter sp.]